MRKLIVVCLTVTALALPGIDALAAARVAKPPKKKAIVTTQQAAFLGTQVSEGAWGDVLVRIIVRKTTIKNGKHVTVRRHIIALRIPVRPNHTARSVYLSSTSLPKLAAEAIDAQSAEIDYISGATMTSDGFKESLQAAILKSERW
jgi:uncharacterized protein with FMN-binding domain